MNLCIDVGNTRVKMAVFDATGDLVTLQITDDLIVEKCSQLINQYHCEYAILSSVRAEHANEMKVLEKQLEAVFVLNHLLPLPIENDYQTPQTLGKDRIAAIVGASVLLPHQNVLVIDAGTCITYDFITKEGRYKGGSILPGIKMRFRSMAEFTAKLPLVEQEELQSFIGTSTKTSMQTGVLYGVLHELNGFKRQYEVKFGNIQVIVTGGDTSYFETQFKNEIFAQPNLVLIGLNQILNYNINNNV